MSFARIAGWVCLALSLNACALFSKGEVPVRRYYSPEPPPSKPVAAEPHSSFELRLGRVTASANISERINYRESANEVGFYYDRIWTEKPEAYLRRGLTHALFEEKGLRRVVRGAAPTLDVELVSFEEVLAPLHVGRVTVAFSLSDERVVSLQQTLTVERPIASGEAIAEGSAVAQAMGTALRDAIGEVSGRVVSEMASASPAQGQQPVLASP
jgi:cholesterol transport system auxiliary component